MQKIKIIFENQDFIVCDKPAMTLSTPDRFKSDRPCLGLQLQEFKKIQIYPVHRLDYEVSGLIMYAKNSRAHKASQFWFEKKIIRKKYNALTLLQNFAHWPTNVPAQREAIAFSKGKEFSWKMKITRGKRRSFESPHGDLAETNAVMREENNGVIGWDMYPITGRAHQLRLELSRHGFPILGDSLYGSTYNLSGSLGDGLNNRGLWGFGGIALRAVQIELDQDQADKFELPSVILID